MMNRILPIILILILVSGCTCLSKTEYVTVEGGGISRSTDSCEYFDVQWALFGRGNYSELKAKVVNASFCSTAFYSKDISMGPIVPIVPLFGSAKNEVNCKKWLKIKNHNEKIRLNVVGLFSREKIISGIEYNTAKYPDIFRKDKERMFISNEGVILPPGGHIWIDVPVEEDLTLILKSNGETIKLKVVKSTGYSWWMITV